MPTDADAHGGFADALCRTLIAGASLVLPRPCRAPWRETWEGELWHRRLELLERDRLTAGARIDLLLRCLGALSHALWLAAREWRSDPMLQDLRYALRYLAKKRAFTTLAVLSLGIGIGAGTVIFSVVDATILRPFPHPEPDRLVMIGAAFPRLDQEQQFIEALTPAEVLEIETQSKTLEHVVAFDLGNRDLGGVDEPERLFSAFVWSDPFPAVGLPPAAGRGFTAEEIETMAPVAIVSHRVWQERFGGDPAALGDPVVINGEPLTLVGVMAPGTELVQTDLWLPMWASRAQAPPSRRLFTVMARIRDGFTLRDVDHELSTLARRIERERGAEVAEYAGWQLGARAYVDVWAGFVGPTGAILLGAIGLVLLVTCANLAAFLLTQGMARQHELTVRAVLGAGRHRLLRQLLAETLLLVSAGGLLGWVVASVGLGPLVAQFPSSLRPESTEGLLSVRAFAFAAGVAALCGLVIGLVPSLLASRVRLRDKLAAGHSRGGFARRASWLRRGAVLAEVTIALVVLVASGLLQRSVAHLQRGEPGLDVSGVLKFRVTLPWQKYQGQDQTRFYEALSERLAALPGVESAAFAAQLPSMGYLNSRMEIEGRPDSDSGDLVKADITATAPGFFETLGIPVRTGRAFAPGDTEDAPLAAVVNEAFVRRYFADQDPIGRRLRPRQEDAEVPWFAIVGIVADVRNHGLDQPPAPEVFYTVRQGGGQQQLYFAVRTRVEPLSLAGAVRQEVRDLDPNLPIYNVGTLEQSFARPLETRQLASVVMTVFALVTLVLAAMGVYGLTAESVLQRTYEIGLRMALGASRRRLVRWMLRQALILTACGLALGMAAAVAFAKVLDSLLFEVRGFDPLTLATMGLLLLGVALVAGWVPAQRAARLDPAKALREL